jgi:transposase
VRDWVIRYDKQSTDGLSDRPHGGGASPKLSVEEKAQHACRVRQGPDITEDSVVRWRLCDLRDRILAGFFVVMDERSVGADPEDFDLQPYFRATTSSSSRCRSPGDA